MQMVDEQRKTEATAKAEKKCGRWKHHFMTLNQRKNIPDRSCAHFKTDVHQSDIRHPRSRTSESRSKWPFPRVTTTLCSVQHYVSRWVWTQKHATAAKMYHISVSFKWKLIIVHVNGTDAASFNGDTSIVSFMSLFSEAREAASFIHPIACFNISSNSKVWAAHPLHKLVLGTEPRNGQDHLSTTIRIRCYDS